jgi:hypothetical protein
MSRGAAGALPTDDGLAGFAGMPLQAASNEMSEAADAARQVQLVMKSVLLRYDDACERPKCHWRVLT